jgi:hypothetical protein
MYAGKIPCKIWKHWKHFRKSLLTNHLPVLEMETIWKHLDQMETSDLPSDAETANATIAMTYPTDSNSVERRSLAGPRKVPGLAHRIGIHTCSSHSGIVDAVEDGGSKMMKRSKHFPYAMTLRLSSPMQCQVENLAYDSRMSKAQFIRTVLRKAIAELHDLPDQYRQVYGGEL